MWVFLRQRGGMIEHVFHHEAEPAGDTVGKKQVCGGTVPHVSRLAAHPPPRLLGDAVNFLNFRNPGAAA